MISPLDRRKLLSTFNAQEIGQIRAALQEAGAFLFVSSGTNHTAPYRSPSMSRSTMLAWCAAHRATLGAMSPRPAAASVVSSPHR